MGAQDGLALLASVIAMISIPWWPGWLGRVQTRWRPVPAPRTELPADWYANAITHRPAETEWVEQKLSRWYVKAGREPGWAADRAKMIAPQVVQDALDELRESAHDPAFAIPPDIEVAVHRAVAKQLEKRKAIDASPGGVVWKADDDA